MQVHRLIFVSPEAAKCIPCCWMIVDFVKEYPLNCDIVQASVGSETAFFGPRDYLSASIIEFSSI
jgi:hypothetical protein